MTLNRTKFTLDEFKAWFEGFGEAIVDAPTPEQWAKIKAKVAEITPAYTGIRVRGDANIDAFRRVYDEQVNAFDPEDERSKVRLLEGQEIPAVAKAY